jgi:hypothetical protein
VHYVAYQPTKAAEHFYGLQEASPDLKGIGIFDHLERGFPSGYNEVREVLDLIVSVAERAKPVGTNDES